MWRERERATSHLMLLIRSSSVSAFVGSYLAITMIIIVYFIDLMKLNLHAKKKKKIHRISIGLRTKQICVRINGTRKYNLTLISPIFYCTNMLCSYVGSRYFFADMFYSTNSIKCAISIIVMSLVGPTETETKPNWRVTPLDGSLVRERGENRKK